MKRYLNTGGAVGLALGFLVGMLVCVFEFPFPNYTLVGNELIVELLRRFLSPQAARAVDSPFRFLLLYALGGAAFGAVAGGLAALVVPLTGRKPSRRGRVGILFTLVATLILTGYSTLFVLHFRLPDRQGILITAFFFLLSLAISAALSFGVSRLVPPAESVRGHRVLPAVLILLLLAETLSIRGAVATHGRGEEGMALTGKKVVLICLDGLGWGVIEPLLKAGELPALGALIENGSHGILRSTLPPIKSPQVWTSVATDRLPADHKVYDFLSYSVERGKWVTTTNRIRRKPAYWDILAADDIPVDVL